MKGKIVRILGDKFFGFIRSEVTRIEYFFHREDYNGHWTDLVEDFGREKEIWVVFEVVQSPKGPRAAGVTRKDYPNQGPSELED